MYDKCLIALLWLFGKRISEVLRLKRKDLWFDEHFLYVRFSILKKKGEYKAVKKITLKNSICEIYHPMYTAY